MMSDVDLEKIDLTYEKLSREKKSIDNEIKFREMYLLLYIDGINRNFVLFYNLTNVSEVRRRFVYSSVRIIVI